MCRAMHYFAVGKGSPVRPMANAWAAVPQAFDVEMSVALTVTFATKQTVAALVLRDCKHLQ